MKFVPRVCRLRRVMTLDCAVEVSKYVENVCVPKGVFVQIRE
jgi:hypothetical protein